MFKTKPIFIIISLLALLVLYFVSAGFIENNQEADEKSRLSKYNKIISIDLPAKLFFAGEEVPLDRFYVREALDYELTVNTYWHSSTISLIKKANRWFPVIEPILKEYNIPNDFKYLAVAESGLANVVSPAGATGFWQIMKATGKEYGLEINNGIDERYHVEKSTEVACKYLLNAYEKYGNWTLAAASYNAGMNRISDEIERQSQTSYYDMVFNIETSRYIYRILAIKQVISHPKNYGFHINKGELYTKFDTYEISVDSTIDDLAAFARDYGMNYKELKIYNPWLRQNYLPDESRKEYYIKLPNK
jgi:membrane-bound lytic murein transglycosylase D